MHIDALVDAYNNLSHEVEVLLLAVKPFKYQFSGLLIPYPEWLRNNNQPPENIRLGLGSLLMAEVEKKFPQANNIKLDTRAVNIGARKLYEHLGFILTSTPDENGRLPTFIYYQRKLTPKLRCC